MNKNVTYFAEEVDIAFGARIIIYHPTGFTYWYKGNEIANKDYDKERFKKALNKHSNKSIPSVYIDYIGEFDWELNNNYFKKYNNNKE